MPKFTAYIASRPPQPRPKLGIVNHPDVSLLAHMAIVVAAQSYHGSGRLRSRDVCFRVAVDFVAKNLWPHTGVVQPELRNRSLFLGQGRYQLGSLRRWVGDLHGLVMAQRLADRSVGRRGVSADSRGKQIRADAAVHPQNIIAVVNKRCQQNVAFAPLLSELQLLQVELF